MKNPVTTFLNNLEENSFDAGYKVGYEDCKHKGMKFSFSDNSKNLTEEEYNEVIEFLVEKNVEIRYDVMNGGLQIRRSK